MIELALRFLYIGLFSIGGGLSAISLIHAEIVDRLGWLTAETLVDIMAIAEMTPGPMAVNAASFVGMSLHGIPGAILATCACVLPGCLISYGISRASQRLGQKPRWKKALKLMRSAVVGVIIWGAVTILKNALCPEGSLDWPALVSFFIGMVVYRSKKLPPKAFTPMALMLTMGGICGGLRLLSLYFPSV